MGLKILHTADWHVGLKSWRTSKEVDRTEEIVQMLEKMVEFASRERVDLVAIAGDILHEWRNPSARALDIAVEYIVRFSKIAPVVLVLGNHDWKGIATFKKLTRKDITIIDQDEDIKKPRIVDTNRGKVVVYGLPYISGSMGILEGMEKVESALQALMGLFQRDDTPGDFRLMVAHVMMEGMMPPSVEETINVLLKPQYLPTTMNYIALGHVHRFSRILPNPPAYYSGSIIQTDFSEIEDKGFIFYEDGDVKFVKLPHKRVMKLDLSEKKTLREVEEEIERVWDLADYMKVIINEGLAMEIGSLRKIEKVIEVSVASEERKIEIEFEGEKFIELFEEYLKLRMSPERYERAMEIIEKVLEKEKA